MPAARLSSSAGPSARQAVTGWFTSATDNHTTPCLGKFSLVHTTGERDAFLATECIGEFDRLSRSAHRR